MSLIWGAIFAAGVVLVWEALKYAVGLYQGHRWLKKRVREWEQEQAVRNFAEPDRIVGRSCDRDGLDVLEQAAASAESFADPWKKALEVVRAEVEHQKKEDQR